MEKCNHKKLFNEYELSSLLANKIKSIKSQVESINEQDFRHIPADKIVARLVLKNSLDQLKLYEHFIRVHHLRNCIKSSSDIPLEDTLVRNNHPLVDGIKVRIEIPFSGDERLWLSQPSSFNVGGGPAFCIKNRKIAKEYIHPMLADKNQIKSEFIHNLYEIKKYLNWQDVDIRQYRDVLRKTVEEAVSKRIAKLQKLEMLSNHPTINLKTKKRTVDFCPINVRQKLSYPLDYNSEKSNEPSITKDDFIKIIRMIRHVGRNCEETANVFRIHKEIELRDIIISALNIQFEDSMEKALFEKEGNTAISISQNGKSAFMSTCKIWSSENRFLKILDCILECNFWTDGKANLILFNKTIKDFPKLLNVAMKIIMGHSNFLSYDKKFDENEWSFTMKAMNDSSCKINLHIMIFNLYADQANAHLRLTEQEIDFFRPSR
ncbi:hypothetical protein [Maridesulfovibrio frigidus]|uniref:hypothetical protein n=1 Tax=Maridesulfovibrio frigidus TaxID=340956 RepID=UPI0004E0E7B8|nr:hypothetical protein [Maridesulfovibrio frigidus]